jgi:hypothetical protein
MVRSSIEDEMPLWVLLLLMGLIKVPIAALMLWIPLRSDDAMNAYQDDAQRSVDEGDGGSGVLSQDPHPHRPAPSGPRRGPHGSPPPPSPRRIRHTRARAIARVGHH